MMTQHISKSDENEVLVTESFNRSGESDARKVIENESENEQESYFYLPPALTTPVAQEHEELQPSKYQISNLISASKVSAFQKFVKQTICEEDEEDSVFSISENIKMMLLGTATDDNASTTAKGSSSQKETPLIKAKVSSAKRS